MDAKAMWDSLTEAQRAALKAAYNGWLKDMSYEPSRYKDEAELLLCKGLLEQAGDDGVYDLTPKGRAIYEAGNSAAGQAGQVAPFPSTPDDHTYIPGLWRVTSTPLPGHPGTMVESYELVSENADELADLKARLAEAQARAAQLEAALEDTRKFLDTLPRGIGDVLKEHFAEAPEFWEWYQQVMWSAEKALKDDSGKEDSGR